MVDSTTMSTTFSRTPPVSQAQTSESHQQAPVTHETMQQVPLQAAGIEERLQCLANGVNQSVSCRDCYHLLQHPLHIHQHEVRMDNEPTLQQVQHI